MPSEAKIIASEERFRRWLTDVSYLPGWNFQISRKGDTLFLQIKVNGTCNVTGEPMKWNSRKWQLSVWMTKGELVQTCLKAVLTATEHEVRETFRYKGSAIFDPHYNLDKLLALRQSADCLDERGAA